MQVGVLRRGKYFKGKKVGKGNAVNEVSLSCNRCSPKVTALSCDSDLFNSHKRLTGLVPNPHVELNSHTAARDILSVRVMCGKTSWYGVVG